MGYRRGVFCIVLRPICVKLAAVKTAEIEQAAGVSLPLACCSEYWKSSLLSADSLRGTPVLSAMRDALQVSMEQAKKVFLTIFLFAHGYASIIANNSLKYDEALIRAQLEQAYRGAVLAAQEEIP